MRLVTFLWRGAKTNARLIGAPADNHVWMQKLDNTDIWFASFRVRDYLRLSYQIAPNIPLVPGTAQEQRFALLAILQADPFNKTPFQDSATDVFSQKSYFALENAPLQPGLPAGAQDGIVEQQLFESEILGNQRNIWLFKTQGFDPTDPEAILLIMYDGLAYLSQGQTPAILNKLHNSGQLPPIAAVFVDSLDSETRWRELACNTSFLDAISTEILPHVRNHFSLTVDPARTVVAGSSLGGCLRHAWLSGIQKVLGIPDEVGILEGSRAVAESLSTQPNAKVVWREYEGGHDFAIWRGAIAEGLLALFGT